MANTHIPQPPRMSITWKVLDHAKQAGDEDMVQVCRAVIIANRIGWRKHGNPTDLRQILAYYEAM